MITLEISPNIQREIEAGQPRTDLNSLSAATLVGKYGGVC